MMPSVARVPVIPVHHHTAPSHPKIPVCTKWEVSDYRSEGVQGLWVLEPVSWESLGCWDDCRCHGDPLLGWALGLVGVV